MVFKRDIDKAIERAAQAVYAEVRQYLQPEDCGCVGGHNPCDYCIEVDFWYELILEAFKDVAD